MSKNYKFFGEFKKFIARGNVMDMAVGMIVGSGFTAIVNSLVKDVFNPIIGLITGGQDFAHLKIVLKPASENVAEVAIRYGAFINAIFNFLLISFVLFTIVKAFNTMKDRIKKEEEVAKVPAPVPAKPADVVILEEIRDLLKNN